MREKVLKNIYVLAETRRCGYVSVNQGGADGTNASPLPFPLVSVASGEGVNHGAVCFGVGT